MICKLQLRFYNNLINKEFEEIIQKKINRIPFHVNRTASDNLAVFVKHKNNGNLAYTHVRKVKGRRTLLKEELKELVGKAHIEDTKDSFIIHGNYKNIIKMGLKNISTNLMIFVISYGILFLCWYIYGHEISEFYQQHVTKDFTDNVR